MNVQLNDDGELQNDDEKVVLEKLTHIVELLVVVDEPLVEKMDDEVDDIQQHDEQLLHQHDELDDLVHFHE